MRWSTTITMMFREHAFVDRFAAARDAGFTGVEIQILEDSPENAARAARDAGIEVALLNLDMGDFLAGGPGLSGVPGREKSFQDALDQGIRAAERLDVHSLHIGPSRVPEGEDRASCLNMLYANLDLALRRAEASGLQLLIEPLNRVDTPDALIGTLDEGLELIARYDGRLGLQFDAYHIACSGEEPTEALERCYPLIRHIQFSDAPGRMPPGEGTIDFTRFFSDLRARAYTGWLGAEYMARGPTAETLGWLKHHG